jgi:hypothetical protein
MDDKGSMHKLPVYISYVNVNGPSVLKIELHVPRRELERKLEIVLFAKNAWMALKSGAKVSWYLPRNS